MNAPAQAPLGIALVAHPHPQQGGTLDNKVVQTLAKTFFALGYAAVRFNFRGVGASAGRFDHGNGETEDALAALAHARARFGESLPVALAGFSFGSFVQTRVAKRVAGRAARAGRTGGQALRRRERSRRHDRDPWRGGRRRAARRRLRMGPAAGAADRRVSRLRPFLSRPSCRSLQRIVTALWHRRPAVVPGA